MYKGSQATGKEQVAIHLTRGGKPCQGNVFIAVRFHMVIVVKARMGITNMKMMKSTACFVVPVLMGTVVKVHTGITSMAVAPTNVFIAALPVAGIAAKVQAASIVNEFDCICFF
jgi:hypothetical protein